MEKSFPMLTNLKGFENISYYTFCVIVIIISELTYSSNITKSSSNPEDFDVESLQTTCWKSIDNELNSVDDINTEAFLLRTCY